MSLKRKLFIIYTLAIIIPLLIFGIGMTVINNKVMKEVQTEFSKQELGFESSNEKRFIHDIEVAATEDLDLALNESFIRLIFERFRDLSKLKVIFNETVIANHERDMPGDDLDFEKKIEILHLDENQLRIEYEFTDRFRSNPERRLQGIFFNRFLVSIVIYLMMHGLFIYYVLRNTIPHLDKLKSVAETIGEGDFEFSVDTTRKDEIGQVYKAFDNMRVSLQTYENNRKELITNISHDLKTPIATIKGYISGIKDGLATSPEKLDKYLEIIYNNSEHLDNLIDDLFLYSKLDVGKVDFDFTQLHFDKYIDYYIDELKLDLEEKKHPNRLENTNSKRYHNIG